MRILGYILLFTICAFIDPAPGDTLKCRQCDIWRSAGTCDPPNECEIDSETHLCSTIKVTQDGQLVMTELDCKPRDNVYCDMTRELASGTVIAEYKCCDTELCNDVIN